MLFFLGLFVMTVLRTLTKAPLTVVNSPYLEVLSSGAELARGKSLTITLKFAASGRDQGRILTASDLNVHLDLLEGL